MSTMLERALSEVVANVNLNEKIRKPRKPKTTARAALGESIGFNRKIESAPIEAEVISSKPKAKPKAKVKTKPKAKKAKKRRATPAQLKAAKTKIKRTDWVKTIASFRANASHSNSRFKMGTPGSAQVTKARLDAWEGFKGLSCFTKGEYLFVTKLKTADAKAAARKAGY